MNGLRRTGRRTYPPSMFMKVFQPLLSEFNQLHWHLNLQSGPFLIADKPKFEELERELETYHVHVPEYEDSTSGLWRPGVISRFSALLIEDEWSYMTGISGSESEAILKARTMYAHPELTPAFMAAVDMNADVFIVTDPVTWLVFSNSTVWLDRLRGESGWEDVDMASLTVLR